jgi:FkbM family methyltransferase
MKQIKAILLRVLGQRAYLQLTSRLFFFYFNNGFLRNNPSYYTHYFVKNFLHKGDTVIDIGANLGYYATQFARLTGPAGKVYAVEPIELYRSVLKQNLAKYTNVEILPYALGEKEGTIKMGNPSSDKFRHGLMRVLDEKELNTDNGVYEVPMKNPADLFANIPEIHYIKCDIEGYEVPVVPAMQPLIQKHRPVMQIETDGENKNILFDMFKKMDYNLFFVRENILAPYTDPLVSLPGDLVAIPGEKTISYKHLFR